LFYPGYSEVNDSISPLHPEFSLGLNKSRTDPNATGDASNSSLSPSILAPIPYLAFSIVSTFLLGVLIKSLAMAYIILRNS